MAYNFTNFDQNLNKVKEWLVKELAAIRTGRATLTLLDGVKVESYGSFLPINQTATVVSEDAKTLRITPYDQSQVSAIEKAINDADLGISTSVDEKGMRVIFPDLTSERRELLIRQAGKKMEEARISIRNEREDIWSEIQKQEKDGDISEDDKFKAKEDMQKKVDDIQKQLEELTNAKETEIKE